MPGTSFPSRSAPPLNRTRTETADGNAHILGEVVAVLYKNARNPLQAFVKVHRGLPQLNFFFFDDSDGSRNTADRRRDSWGGDHHGFEFLNAFIEDRRS
ncbi:MAG: hypothetical protein R6U50_09010 [Desulfobacterales bacterium]